MQGGLTRRMVLSAWVSTYVAGSAGAGAMPVRPPCRRGRYVRAPLSSRQITWPAETFEKTPTSRQSSCSVEPSGTLFLPLHTSHPPICAKTEAMAAE